jgi:hypothetical protein
MAGLTLRKQYHFRPGPQGLRAWDVHRLIELAELLPIVEVPLSAIRELDEPFWPGDGSSLTVRNVVEHAQLINDADLSYPIILSSDGRVMDGMHRVAKALTEKRTSLPARRFVEDPTPDYVGVAPDDLPY